MLNPQSGEDSGVVKVLAISSKIGKNLTHISVSYILAAEHVRGLYAVGFVYNTISLPTPRLPTIVSRVI